MGVSKNSGTQKWMVYNGKPLLKWDDLGEKHPYAIHMYIITLACPVLSTQHPHWHRAWDLMHVTTKSGRSQLPPLSPIGRLVDINNIPSMILYITQLYYIYHWFFLISQWHLWFIQLYDNYYACRVCLLFQPCTLIVDSLHRIVFYHRMLGRMASTISCTATCAETEAKCFLAPHADQAYFPRSLPWRVRSLTTIALFELSEASLAKAWKMNKNDLIESFCRNLTTNSRKSAAIGVLRSLHLNIVFDLSCYSTQTQPVP